MKPNKWSFLNLTKPELRASLLKKRAEINPSYRLEAEAKAIELLSKSLVFSQARHCACYLATTSEFNCDRLIELIWSRQKKCYLPILTPEKKLRFGIYNKNDVLLMNRYQILEPVADKLIEPKELDLVILPLVGFNQKGGRLGMGGGYYDRSFEFKKKHKNSPPFLLGLAFGCQETDQLEVEPWDIPLDGILTEKKLHLFNK